MKIEDIRRVVIVGAGNMGKQIGTLCAIHEFEVVLYDISQDILERAFQTIRRLLRHFINKKSESVAG